MASIKSVTDVGRDVTFLEVAGKPEVEEICAWLDDLYRENVTRHVLWDFSAADAANMTYEGVRLIARKVRIHSLKRENPRTAFVFSSSLEYGIGRMFMSVAEMEEIPMEFMLFRSREEAEKWLGFDP